MSSTEELKPMRFRKRPVVIEAIQWDGSLECAHKIAAWAGGNTIAVWTFKGFARLAVLTLEGRMQARPHDWIIRGIAGEFYFCKPDIFEATYESVADVAAEEQGFALLSA